MIARWGIAVVILAGCSATPRVSDESGPIPERCATGPFWVVTSVDRVP